jgi:hypothetical protein
MLKASQIAFLSILVLVGDAWGHSQRHSKRGREGSQTQSQPKEAQQAPTADQRGTDQVPVVVKVIPPKETEEKAARDTKDREEKMELDRKLVQFNGDLAYYTKVLVWVAGLQFLALIVQGVVFALTLGATRKAADAKRAANAAPLKFVVDGVLAKKKLPQEPPFLVTETFPPNHIIEPDPKARLRQYLHFDIPLKPGEWSPNGNA